ncbi:MAG: hypothetical protein EOO88_55440, partial [Pedobacter sp.]
SHRLSIAATAAVLFITVSVLFWLKGTKRDEALVGQNKQVEVAIAPEASKQQPATVVAPVADSLTEQAKVDRAPIVATTIRPPKVSVPAVAQVAPAQETPIANAEAKNVMMLRSAEQTAKSDVVEEITINAKKAVVARASVQQLESKAPGVNMNANIFRGKVYDENGIPLTGASVKIEGRNIAAITDRNGDFRIAGDSSERLAVAYLGFNPKVVDAKSTQLLNIQLEPSTSALNEVVLTGGSIARKEVGSFAVPENGWTSYEAYLKENNQILKSGISNREVQLSFVIDVKGLPTQIKVIKSATDLMDKEAIRLLQNGPKWSVGAGKTTLAHKLAQHFRWEVFLEEVDDNPYLKDFYADMPRWAFHLQVYFLNGRFRQTRRIKELVSEGKSVIQDRTI